MFTPEQVQAMLDSSSDQPDRWIAAVNTVLMDLYKEHATTRKGAVRLAQESKAIREFLQQTGGGGGAGAADTAQAETSMVGSDGTPLDAQQAEAERLMNDAAGPRGGGGPAPSGNGNGNGNGKRAKAAAAPMVGADGNPLDEAQSEAERLMNEAAGPRQ